MILIDLSLRRAGYGPDIDTYLAQFCKGLEYVEPG